MVRTNGKNIKNIFSKENVIVAIIALILVVTLLPMSVLAVTNPVEYTKSIAGWHGKVLLVRDMNTGQMVSASNGIDGVDTDNDIYEMSKYCKKYFPDTNNAEPYKLQTLEFYDRGNKVNPSTRQPYSAEVTVYRCTNNPQQNIKGTFAITKNSYKGSDITSVSKGDSICQAEFGNDGNTWQWVEFHNQQGWGVNGNIANTNNPTTGRVWININDQNSECFSTNNQYGMTWYYDSNKGISTCNIYTGLEG